MMRGQNCDHPSQNDIPGFDICDQTMGQEEAPIFGKRWRSKRVTCAASRGSTATPTSGDCELAARLWLGCEQHKQGILELSPQCITSPTLGGIFRPSQTHASPPLYCFVRGYFLCMLA
ncbi:hypothetical protein HDV64DRAFT_34059 [Trichoderma sp. TUCIM 5745]